MSNTEGVASLVSSGFPYQKQKTPIHQLSFGERARIAFLILRQVKHNIFFLDEPTNHLDLDGQDQLEVEILISGSACLLVSHDKRMVEEIGTIFYRIVSKKLVEIDKSNLWN